MFLGPPLRKDLIPIPILCLLYQAFEPEPGGLRGPEAGSSGDAAARPKPVLLVRIG